MKKKITYLLVAVALLMVAVILAPSDRASAYNYLRNEQKELKFGKTDKSYKLTDVTDGVYYILDVKKTGDVKFDYSASDVTGIIEVGFIASGVDNAPLCTERVEPENGKVKGSLQVGGVLFPGQYYMFFRGASSSVTTGKISAKATFIEVEMDDGDLTGKPNDSYKDAQEIKLGYENGQKLSIQKLNVFCLGEDSSDWLKFKVKETGTYQLRFKTEREPAFSVSVELLDSNRTQISKWNMDKKGLDVVTKDLEPGEYYLNVYAFFSTNTGASTYPDYQIVYTASVQPNVSISSCKLSQKKLTLYTEGKNTSAKLKCTTTPANATIRNMVWKSSDTSVATVDSEGKVTAVGPGTAIITCKITGKRSVDVSSKCEVTVIKETIKLNSSSLTIGVGESRKVGFTASTTKGLQWVSSNPKTVKIDKSTGEIKGVKAGSAKIYAKLPSGVTSAKCKVKVINVKLSESSISLKKGSSQTLKATVSKGETYTWSSSDTSVAKVSAGKVTAVGAGTATITVKTKSGLKASCKVTVTSPESAPKEKPPTVIGSTSISLKGSSSEVSIGTSEVTITLESGTTCGTWSCTDGLTFISKGDSSAVITGKKVGIGTVTYSAGGVSGSVMLRVTGK